MGDSLQEMTHQAEEDLKELHGIMKKMFYKAQDTAKGLRETADKLHELWRDCKIANAAGTTAGIAGGVLTVGGGIATIMTARAVAPLLILGMGIGVAGAGTNLGASIVESSINSNVIKKAEKDSKENLQHINDVNNTVQLWLDRTEEARLLYIGCLAVRTLDINVSTLKFLQVLPAVHLPATIVEVGRRLALEAGKTSAVQAARRARALGARRAGAQGAANVAQAGAGGKLAGRLIIGASILLLVWDAIDLGFAIRDIVENKGSEEAICLRQKADQLDKEKLNNN